MQLVSHCYRLQELHEVILIYPNIIWALLVFKLFYYGRILESLEEEFRSFG